MPALKTKWQPHEGQEKIRESDARFRIIACGRRWGKTELAAHEIFEEAFNNPGTLCWWVAPAYHIAEIGYKKVKNLIPEGFVEDITRTKPKSIELTNGSLIEFRSAGKEDGLVGEGVTFLVIDEASMVPSRAWKKEMRPTLSDTMGRMLSISTPKGKNWFHEYYQRGQSDEEEFDEVMSWSSPTYENPHVRDSEVEAAKRELPSRIFEQEYLARFVEDSGGVFENVRENIVDEGYDWNKTRGEPPYFIGVDFARQQAWTVINVLDGTGRLVHFWRGQHMGWPMIQARVVDAYDMYEGRAYVDASRDNKIISDLEEVGVPVEPINFSSKKQQMIENLILAIEKGNITIPDIPQMIHELQTFERTTTPAGNVRYHAPDEEGFFDDCVDSLALSNWARVGAGRKKVTRRQKTSHVSKASWMN